MKKALALVIFLVMTISSVACGNTSSSPTVTTVAAVTTVRDSKPFSINISGWFFGDLKDSSNGNAAYVNYFTSAYKKLYPNITVNINNMPSEKYFEVVKAKLASNSADELVFHDQASNTLLSKAGYLMDLSSFPFAKDLLSAAKTGVVYQGKVYGAPQAMQTFGCFYNKKLFAENKVSVPKNWAEFLAACEQLKANGIIPLGAGFKVDWVIYHTFQNIFIPNFVLDSKPNFLVDAYYGKEKLDSPVFKNAINQFASLATKGYFQEGMFSTDFTTSMNNFAMGKYAMLIQGQWTPGQVDAAKNATLTSKDIGYFPIAGTTGKPIISLGIDHILSINANVANKTPVIDLFNLMVDQTALALAAKDTAFPGIKATVNHTIPAFIDIQKALTTSISTVPGYTYMPDSVWNIALTKILRKALLGKGVLDADLIAADKTYLQDKALATHP